jgi:hypothetical protein
MRPLVYGSSQLFLNCLRHLQANLVYTHFRVERDAANPDLRKRCKAAVGAHRRREKADGQALDYTAADLATIAAATRTCPYCGRPLLLPARRVCCPAGGPDCLY